MSDMVRTKEIRLKNWDYCSGGFYYVTICVDGMKCSFGKIADTKMFLSRVGEIAGEEKKLIWTIML